MFDQPIPSLYSNRIPSMVYRSIHQFLTSPLEVKARMRDERVNKRQSRNGSCYKNVIRQLVFRFKQHRV